MSAADGPGDERDAVIAACRELARRGLVHGTSGNVSLRCDHARFFVSPTGLAYEMLGFAACKMIRRILGFAHVIDFEHIRDLELRARCEAGALTMARLLLTHPQQFRSMVDVADAVPRMAPQIPQP